MTNGRAYKLHRLRAIHLFAGAGGGILSGILLGHVPVCAVEINPYCQQVLHQRQQDGILPWFPIYSDVKTFDGNQWRGKADIVAGGFPCQDISQCNDSTGPRQGINGKRSGLWSEFKRIICEVKPRYAFVENSPMLSIRGLGTVLGDLAEIGYDARWDVFRACDIGSCHRRARMWILAYPNEVGRPQAQIQSRVIPENIRAKEERKEKSRRHFGDCFANFPSEAEFSKIRGDDDVMAEWMDRLEALGNGQIPAVASLAWKTLMP